MSKRIEIRIRPDGSIEAETQGMKGTECLPWIGELERMLDAKTVDSRFTDEYYQGAEITQDVQTDDELRLGRDG